ncbi:MAG TPA: MSMEG_0568 family radical SAM protein [Polyangiaceae bacterium]|jgi:radical SAM protein (TIGR04043 family)|nr:MSMEG_0568 family radical SAM protein [Polyangiaceae bacterium]
MAMMSLPLLQPSPSSRQALTELQALGARFITDAGTGLSRKGGAGPSDHKAIVFDGHTVMIPIHTAASLASPYALRASGPNRAVLERSGMRIGDVTFPEPPKFYGGETADGIPYWKIAQLHAADVLATTVLQTCIRYNDRKTSCQFCAIGQSLEAGRTVARKTPAQLAEVAEAAVRLDGVKHMVMTTGTPASADRGARVLTEAAAAVTARVALPIQAQCEPPADDVWFERLRDAGVVTLGMHLESVTDRVRQKIMPGKAEVPISRYLSAFERAVAIFGRGQVSTYILAGLGDSHDEIVDMCRTVGKLGVYPFVVPFVPIAGTPLEKHTPPEPGFMRRLLPDVAAVIRDVGLSRNSIRAGCGRCGACSTLQAHEGAA